MEKAKCAVYLFIYFTYILYISRNNGKAKIETSEEMKCLTFT